MSIATALVRSTLALAGLAFGASALTPVAGADPLYRWESEDGSLAFTDDARRIPERYREQAEPLEREDLAGYDRFTPTDSTDAEAYAARLAARLDALRAVNAEALDAAAGEGAAPDSGIRVLPQRRINTPTRRLTRRADGSLAWRRGSQQRTVLDPVPDLALGVDPDDPNPVVIEKRQVRVPMQPVTQTVTVVRQGDRVLSIVKPRSHYYDLDFGDLDDLESGID